MLITSSDIIQQFFPDWAIRSPEEGGALWQANHRNDGLLIRSSDLRTFVRALVKADIDAATNALIETISNYERSLEPYKPRTFTDGDRHGYSS